MSRNYRPRYTFGDTPLAAERLQLVARVFESPSRSWTWRGNGPAHRWRAYLLQRFPKKPGSS